MKSQKVIFLVQTIYSNKPSTSSGQVNKEIFMNTVKNIKDLRQQVKAWRLQGLTIAFVPTMGNLHDGHLALVKAAHRYADKVIVSIFVNPMQFGLSEDIDNYPKTLAEDKSSLIKVNTDLLFIPTSQIIYPKGYNENSYVEVPNISHLHCGASRPGHFRGVATVVCKLFNLVQPDVACFGSKDYQQLQVIADRFEIKERKCRSRLLYRSSFLTH